MRRQDTVADTRGGAAMRSWFIVLCLLTTACGSSRTQALGDDRFVFPTEGRVVDLTFLGSGGESGAAEARGTEVVGSFPDVGNCVAPLVVIDWREQADFEPDARLSRTAIEDWERRYGTIPRRAVIALRTGWATRRGHPGLFEARDADGVPHFPGFSAAAVEYLVRDRRATALLTEAPGLDSGDSAEAAPVMRLLREHGGYGIVGVTGLQDLPVTGSLAIVAPFPEQGAIRSLVRVYAIAPRGIRRQ